MRRELAAVLRLDWRTSLSDEEVAETQRRVLALHDSRPDRQAIADRLVTRGERLGWGYVKAVLDWRDGILKRGGAPLPEEPLTKTAVPGKYLEFFPAGLASGEKGTRSDGCPFCGGFGFVWKRYVPRGPEEDSWDHVETCVVCRGGQTRASYKASCEQIRKGRQAESKKRRFTEEAEDER